MKEAFRECLRERHKRINPPEVLPMGDVYFRGIPVECCESLADEEYAFVKGIENPAPISKWIMEELP